MGGKVDNNTVKTTSTTSPTSGALSAYQDVVGKAQAAANAPYQPYTGELTAGLNQGQKQAIGQLEGSYGLANPYINSGSQAAGDAQSYAQGAAGLSNPYATAAYMSPYLQNAVGATMANINESNQEQQQGLASQAIGAGAFGGDRAGIAASSLARQQALAENQTIAGMENQGFAQATAARQADANTYGNLANSANQSAQVYGGLGSLAQTSAIQGASAGLQGATLQQQTQQAQDNAAYQQWQNARAYPFQTIGWLGNLVEGIGSQEGSTTVGTQPAPSMTSQIAGAATTGLGILGSTGAFGSNGYLSKIFADGGRVGFAHGGPVIDMTAGSDGVYREGFMDGGPSGLSAPTDPFSVNVPGSPVSAPPSQGLNFSPTALLGSGNYQPLQPGRGLSVMSQPPAPTTPTGLAAAPAVAAPAPDAGSSGGSTGSSGGFGGDNAALWQGVMSAGLGMMAGQSPYAMSNIGAGGLTGLKTYQAVKQQDRENTLSQKEIEMKAQQLHQQMVQQDREFGLQQDQFNLNKALATRKEHPWTVIGEDAYGNKKYGYAPEYGSPEAQPAAQQQPGALDASLAKLQGQPMLDALNDADPRLGGQVKAIVEGRAPYPTGMLLKTPYGQRLAALVTQADPTFESGNAGSRTKVRNEFESGGPNSPAGTITAGNTAIQHLGHLADAADQLGNGSVPLLNRAINAGAQAVGKGTAATKFDNIQSKYVEEVTKFYRGTGGTEADLQRDLANLNSTQSPAQLRAALEAQAELLQSKVNALQERWHQGMGPMAGDFPIVHPESQKVLDRLTGKGEKDASTGAPAAPAPAPASPMAVNSAEDFAKLPSGTTFTAPDGSIRTKP